MSVQTVLSVDGSPGLDYAQGREAHLATPGTDAAVTLLGNGEPGRHGVNAPAALPGRPAGLLAVRTAQSQIYAGGLTVTTLAQVGTSRVPDTTEILPRGQLLLSAKGGAGEPGRRGGNGQSGMPGRPGIGATETADATDGGRGGDGGNAGSGSCGGTGGAGGTVEIHVDEDATHLLLAASWDVTGGEGGEPGRHGEPGVGGEGGAGGDPHIWEAQAGYKYRCTENCVGSTRTSMTARGAQDPTITMMRNVGAQMSQGSVLTTAVARAAQVFHSASHTVAGGGACRCHGGPEHCPGCAATPLWRTFSKPRGVDGRRGEMGLPVLDILLRGGQGAEGRAAIVVNYRTGERARYSHRFSLQLEDYDLEDENGDGIFEPGERIFVRRIKVKNTGGMPSPSCAITCAVVATDTLESVDADDGLAIISRSIAAGHAATSQDTAQTLIQIAEIDPRSRQSYIIQQAISLRATVPWLDQQLENFNLEKSITVQYPLELREVKTLETVGHGTVTEISWEVFNKSNVDFGAQGLPARQAKIRVTMFDEEDGLLHCARNNTWLPLVDIVVPPIKARGSTILTQKLRLALDGRPHKRVKTTLALYISPASAGHVLTPVEISGLQLVQSCDAEMQLAPGHVYHEDSDVLVITNTDTSESQIEALQDFLENQLMLQVDIWNLSLYGSLFTADSGGTYESESILQLYRGKVVIFLGNKFDFFGNKGVSCLGLCDATSLSDACKQGTSCLFLGPAHEPVDFEELILSVSDRALDGVTSLPDTGCLPNAQELIRAVEQDTRSGDALYRLPVPTRRYFKRRWNVSRFANGIVKALCEHLPQERFAVCPVESDSPVRQGYDGQILIYRGLQHQTSICSAQSGLFHDRRAKSLLYLPGATGTQKKAPGSGDTLTLDRYDQLTIVNALTFSQRVDLLWSSGRIQDDRAIPDEVMGLLILSTQRDLVSEIGSFLNGSRWPNRIEIGRGLHKCLSTHLPGVQLVFGHLQATGPGPVPPEIIRLLYYILAACRPQSKRHVAEQAILPFGHRRSQLRSALTRRVEALLLSRGLDEDELSAFHAGVSSVCSNGMRRTDLVLAEELSQATGKSIHFLDKARVGLTDIYPRTRRWTRDEWDARYNATLAHEKEVSELMQRAWDETQRLNTDGGGLVLAHGKEARN